MSDKGMLVVFSGPSGVGKDTVLERFLAAHPRVRRSVSATTRAPRPGEQDGVDYYFLTEEEFRRRIDSGDMLEYTRYSGNYYGTPREMVEREREQGYDVLLKIEVQGGMNVKAAVPETLMIFLLPPSLEELRRRLAGRATEDEAAVAKRLEAARFELAQAQRYDYAVVNDQVDRAVEQLGVVLCAAKCSVANMREFIEEVQKL